MSAEPWFVDYERAALGAGRKLAPMPDPLSNVFGGPQPDYEQLERLGVRPVPPASEPHTPGVLGLIRDALVGLGRWLR